MFTAYLIDDPSYYQLKNRYQFYSLGLNLIFVVMLPILFSGSFLLNLLLLALMIFSVLYSILRLRKTAKQIETLSKQTRIRLSETELLLEKADGSLVKKLGLDEDSLITASPNYEVKESKLVTIIQQFQGKPKPNHLTVEMGGASQTFDLFLDSEYQIGQLKKLLSSWEQKGMLQYRAA